MNVLLVNMIVMEMLYALIKLAPIVAHVKTVTKRKVQNVSTLTNAKRAVVIANRILNAEIVMGRLNVNVKKVLVKEIALQTFVMT